MCQLKDLILTLFGLIFRRMYIYITLFIYVQYLRDPIFPSFLFVIPKIKPGVWLSKLRMTEADIARVLHNVELVDLLLDEEKRTRFKLLRTFHQLN